MLIIPTHTQSKNRGTIKPTKKTKCYFNFFQFPGMRSLMTLSGGGPSKELSLTKTFCSQVNGLTDLNSHVFSTVNKSQ